MMRQPIIESNSIDLEENPYNPLSCMKYKGEWFTGTVLYEDNKSYTEYKDGNADGRCLEYYSNGQIACDCIYKEGGCTSEKIWYSNNQLRSDGVHLFDEDGKLIKVNESWLYFNGTKINEAGEGEHYYFSSKGELAIKVVVNMAGDYNNTINFYP